MIDKVLDALKFIDAATVSYTEWIQVGQALKEEGYDVDIWEDWSKNDKRFRDGECKRKWESFKGATNPVTGATIIQMAKNNGYSTSHFEGDGCLDWSDVIEYDGDGVVYEMPNTESPCKQLITYLKTLFNPDDLVSYVTSDVWQDSSGKWMPKTGVSDRTAKELIESLEKYPNDLGATIGDWQKECGAWIRFNPVDGKGVKNDNITRFDYALVESDDMPLSEQDAAYRRLELPIACLVNSAGKSIHAIVKVNAKNYEEYRSRVDFLYEFLNKNGIKIDKQNRNPSRLSRMPGVTRNGKEQTLIATNIGRKNWTDWMDFVEGVNDELPALKTLDKETLANLPALPEELIEGVLRKGHKMLISGSSKAGKSFLLMELCIALSEGKKWLNRFNCKKSKVLYVNLEIDEISCLHRFSEIYKAMKIEPQHSSDIVIWNLRGHAVPLDKLVPKLIRRAKNEHFNAIIIDPIYKVITGDENNASEMGAFCNQFDKICTELGCSTVYCHHHSKGAQGYKKAMDRASGSGVFSRDPDAQLDLIQLDVDQDFIVKNADTPTSTAWRLESSLREFANFKPVNIWFNYPLHTLDKKGVLEGIGAEGSVTANLAKSYKRKQTPESRKEEFDTAFDACLIDGYCTTEELADYLGVSVRTIQKRVAEFNECYLISKGNVYKRT